MEEAEDKPEVSQEVRDYLGRIGSIKTAAKSAASAKNGRSGGRPKGIPQSEETKEKIRAAKIGKKRTEPQAGEQVAQ